MQTITPSNRQSALVKGLIEASKLTTAPLPDPRYNGPVSIARKVGDSTEVMLEHGSDKARVFSSPKAAHRWIKRNVQSPAERRKLLFIKAVYS
jgi:hypothetical protein